MIINWQISKKYKYVGNGIMCFSDTELRGLGYENN